MRSVYKDPKGERVLEKTVPSIIIPVNAVMSIKKKQEKQEETTENSV